MPVASRRAVLTVLTAGALAGCGRTAGIGAGSGGVTASPASSPSPSGAIATGSASPLLAPVTPTVSPAVTRAQIVAAYGHRAPRTWGFGGPGVIQTVPAQHRVIALTFDACGGPGGSGYDRALITFLRRREIPATLFLNSRWIDENPAAFRQLAGEPLFEIGNHGTRHLPLSVTGRSAYGIGGTRDAGQVYDEVAGNQAKLSQLMGRPPRFFRAGTAYSDDVAARIVGAMGERLVTFAVNGDGGATFTPGEVAAAVTGAAPGSVVICHMNHPEGGTARGIAAAVPRLLASGHHFVRLPDELH